MYAGPPKECIPLACGVFSVLDPGLCLCTERRTGEDRGEQETEGKN